MFEIMKMYKIPGCGIGKRIFPVGESTVQTKLDLSSAEDNVDERISFRGEILCEED